MLTRLVGTEGDSTNLTDLTVGSSGVLGSDLRKGSDVILYGKLDSVGRRDEGGDGLGVSLESTVTSGGTKHVNTRATSVNGLNEYTPTCLPCRFQS